MKEIFALCKDEIFVEAFGGIYVSHARWWSLTKETHEALVKDGQARLDPVSGYIFIKPPYIVFDTLEELKLWQEFNKV